MAEIQRQATLSNSPLFRKTPWPGVAAVLGMATCLIASAVVIGISHNDTVASWRVPPAVLLAVLAAASNIVFNTALATGIAVRFWLCAARGVKLSQLHYIWDHGRVLGIGSAVRAGPPARTVALVALLANVMQFVGAPLLQRSVYQVVEYRMSNQIISMDLASQIPDGWFGTWEDGAATRNRVNSNLGRVLPIMQQWWRNSSVTTHYREGYRCDGTCSGWVRGAGFAYQCWSAERRFELATNATDGESVFLIYTTPSQNGTGPPFLRLISRYLENVDGGCVGTLREDTCDLEPATVEYPVTIQNHTIYLRGEELTASKPRVISQYSSSGDSINAPSNSGIGPLTFLNVLAYTRVTDNATKVFEDGTASYYAPGMTSDIFFVSRANKDDKDAGSKARCPFEWSRPTEYVISTLYDFMFRSALQVGNGTETQTFTADLTVPTLVFRSDARYLVAGLVVTAGGLGLVALLMWGWWRLERPVTLSPLETANAMGAPILREVERSATISEILAKAWHLEFKLREAEAEAEVQTSATVTGVEKT